jgi:hypothetical protein
MLVISLMLTSKLQANTFSLEAKNVEMCFEF